MNVVILSALFSTDFLVTTRGVQSRIDLILYGSKKVLGFSAHKNPTWVKYCESTFHTSEMNPFTQKRSGDP